MTDAKRCKHWVAYSSVPDSTCPGIYWAHKPQKHAALHAGAAALCFHILTFGKDACKGDAGLWNVVVAPCTPALYDALTEGDDDFRNDFYDNVYFIADGVLDLQ